MPNKTAVSLIVALTAFLGFLTAPAFAASKEKILYSFCSVNLCADGEGPDAGLIFDTNGNLYGTAYAGGTYDDGIVFELVPNKDQWSEEVLHVFGTNNNDGAWPTAGLILDKDGNLYGTTWDGGAYGNAGLVFELVPNHGKWTEKLLHSFNQNGKDGFYPYAGLIPDTARNLYGTTYFGGAYSCGTYSCGTVFELIPNHGKWTEKLLHSFNGNDGANPEAALMMDPAGNLYGTTQQGGTYGKGTVFELIPNHGKWTEKVLHSFNGKDGAGPAASLIRDAAGNLYGTTWEGGAPGSACFGYGCGTVVELLLNGGEWTEKVLHSFKQDGSGYSLADSLTLDTDGNLYGTTYYGGADETGCAAYGCGTVFELIRNNGKWTEKVLHSFNETDGGRPWAGVIFDSAGNLYGTTVAGGAMDAGTVFEITP